jgi:hypothetical protein
MSYVLLGLLTSASLIGSGIFLLNRDTSKLSGNAATPKQLRQGGWLALLFGVVMAGFAVYLFLRGMR